MQPVHGKLDKMEHLAEACGMGVEEVGRFWLKTYGRVPFDEHRAEQSDTELASQSGVGGRAQGEDAVRSDDLIKALQKLGHGRKIYFIVDGEYYGIQVVEHDADGDIIMRETDTPNPKPVVTEREK